MSGKTSTKRQVSQQNSNHQIPASAGPKRVAIAPPTYGSENVDSRLAETAPEPAFGAPVQMQVPSSPSAGDGGAARDSGAGPQNHTGLPDALKTGVESISGLSLDDVRVHYNSSRPAQLQALAYTQGADIHVAPGQERHLPHEAWHVVQQKQGRVRPTLQLKGTGINNDTGLEKEADLMGAKAALPVTSIDPVQKKSNARQTAKSLTVQRAVDVAGGSFDTKAYATHTWDNKTAATKEYGAKIILEFTPSSNLGANGDTVSLVQSVKDDMKLTTPQYVKGGKGKKENVETEVWKDNKTAGFDLRMTDSGAIDQQLYDKKGNLVNLDPRYAEQRMAENNSMKAHPQGDLSKLKKDGGDLEQGHVFSAAKSNNAWNTAVLSDEPTIPVKTTTSTLSGTQEFEVAALHEPKDGTPVFVGSVKWGWKVANGAVSITPLAKADNKASADFFKASKAWNEMEVLSNRGKKNSQKKSVVKQLPIE